MILLISAVLVVIIYGITLLSYVSENNLLDENN